MAANLKFCHVCYQKHVTKPSTAYCSDCDQVFCSDCESFHSSIQATSDHVTMSMSDYLSLDESFRNIRNLCSNHEEKYQMYCQSHEIPLCLSCVAEHSACKDVLPLTKIIQNLNFSQFVKDIEDSLNDLEKNVSTIKAYLQKNTETLSTNQTAVLSEISKTRQKINDCLDKLERRVRKKIKKQETKARKQINSVLTSIDTKTLKLLSEKNQVTIFKDHGTNIHTFLALKKISLELNSSEKAIKIMVEDGSLDRLSLKCEINDKLSQLSSDIETFGDVGIEKSSFAIKLDNYKERQAQHVITESKSTDNINKKLVQSFDDKNMEIRGCDINADCEILLTDYSDKKCLICFDTRGKHLFDISIEPYDAFDVICIDKKTVAVTYGSTKGISTFDISNRTVKKQIDVHYSCYGVTYKDGTLLTCAEGQGILSVRLIDEKITTFVRCDLPGFSYITTYQDKLFYTNRKTKTVTCCDIEGNTVWTFKDEAVIRYPKGITTDNKGRVYVCDSVNDAVIVLSSDGKQSKQLVSKDDGLCSPNALHFDKKKNNLLVANEKDKFYLFHVTS